MSLFLNGIRQATTTNSTNFSNANNYSMNVGRAADGSVLYTGYISNPRIVKGSSVYTPSSTTLTVPTAPLTAITNTSYLLNLTNAGIFDSTAKNVLETVGNAQVSTTQAKWGTTSIAVTGTGDYCRGAPSILQDINGGDFVIEGWVRFTSVASDRAIVSKYGNSAETVGNAGYLLQWVQATSVLRLVLGTGSADSTYTWSWSPSINTWYYFAVSRSGTSGRAYIDGTQIGSTATLTTSDTASPNGIQIGKTHTTAQYTLGYFDDLRITKGSARGYTGTTITVPTAAFPLQ
jgi:hypothetical protein